MKEIMNNPLWSSVILLVCQIVFIYLKTINVIYTTEKKIWPSIITGAGVGILTLISFSIGINSIFSGKIIPIIVFVIGGAIGTYIGIKQNEKNENN